MDSTISLSRTKAWATLAAAVVALAGVLAGCTDEANPLAPYEGSRALEFMKVTQNFTPEIQWVGGRVAAVGVNRGSVPALDTSLVWLQTAPGDDISSFVTVGQNTAADLVRSFGGTPVDSLTDGEEYTFWIAEKSAFDVALDSTQRDPASFADTTFRMELVLRGNSGGDRDLDVEYRVVREERLLENRFVVTWTPEVPFRRLAIRVAPPATGGFTDLIWHVLIPDDEEGEILPPVIIGETPPGAVEAAPFQGFVVDDVYNPMEDSTAVPVHVLWAVTEDWDGTFGFTATGYAFLQIRGCNFDIDRPCP